MRYLYLACLLLPLLPMVAISAPLPAKFWEPFHIGQHVWVTGLGPNERRFTVREIIKHPGKRPTYLVQRGWWERVDNLFPEVSEPQMRAARPEDNPPKEERP